MRIAKLLIIALFTTFLVHAQESAKQEEKAQADEKRNWAMKVFQVKYADVNQLADLFRTFGASVEAKRNLKALAVRAPEGVLAAIEEALKRLDVAPPPLKDIDLTVYLLIASAQESATGKTPAELDPVIKQLKTVFNYRGFRLLDTLMMRQREDTQGTVNGTVASPTSVTQQPVPYRFHVNSVRIGSDDTAGTVHINGLSLNLQVPFASGPPVNVGIGTDVDVREGQKVVVGKANIDNSENALILVLTARAVD
jgi:type II/III secretion system protein